MMIYCIHGTKIVKERLNTNMLTNEKTVNGVAVPAFDLSKIEWTCKKCGARLDGQTGFGTDKKKWKCTECGFKNDVSSKIEFYEAMNYIIKELVLEG